MPDTGRPPRHPRPSTAGIASRYPQLGVQGYVIFFRYVDERFEVVNIIEGHRDIDELFSPVDTDE